MFAIHARSRLVAQIPAQAPPHIGYRTDRGAHGKHAMPPHRKLHQGIDGKNQAGSYTYVFVVYTSYVEHNVFQNMPFGYLGGLNFVNLVTC